MPHISWDYFIPPVTIIPSSIIIRKLRNIGYFFEFHNFTVSDKIRKKVSDRNDRMCVSSTHKSRIIKLKELMNEMLKWPISLI